MPGLACTIRRAAFDLLFPPACASCGDGLQESETDQPLCPPCLGQLAFTTGPTCGRCGAPTPVAVPSQAKSGCFRCKETKLHFDGAFAMGRYEGKLRDLLLRMKRSAGDPLSLSLGRLLWHRCQDRLASLRPDVVVQVPRHWRRRLQRGTNSASLVAEILARQLQAPFAMRLLRRQRSTPPQHSVPPSQRFANVRRAFSMRTSYHLCGAHVLLVDDILTTGATCSEAAKTLKRHGAVQVTAVVVARSTSG